MSTKNACIALLFAVAIGAPATAAAQRKSPLADAPAVRNRVELRQKRAELGVGMGTSLNQDFYHAVMFNVRGGFHINDWIGVGAQVGLNVSPNFKTGFHERLVDVLPPTGTGAPMKEPTGPDAQKSMNKIGEAIALQLEVTPFTGKYSMFGKLPFSYDFYGFVGPGFLHLKSDETNPCSSSMGRSCKVDGFKVGANFGIGMHTFINHFLAINLELRDILIKNNPSGRDETGNKIADEADLTWDSNYFVGMGLTFFLPTSASITP